MSAPYDFDLFVIGAGSGGVRCARIAATHGARVGIAEERYLGGTCVNVGCVPKKLMTYAAGFSHAFHDAAGYGWTVGQNAHDWATLIRNKDQEIARLNGIYAGLLTRSGVTLYQQRAELVDPHTVRLADGTEKTAERILIAVGGWPQRPPHPGQEHGITSNEVFHLEDLPQRVLVVGGGYIALEFAGIFRGLGRDVSVLYRGEKVLRGFDEDLRDGLMEEYRRQGIDFILGTVIETVEKDGDGVQQVRLASGRTLEADLVFYAIGRAPLVKGLVTDGRSLSDLGVELDPRSGAILVDEQYQTSVPSLYALGDVTNTPKLTPVAIAEGHVLADRLFAGSSRAVGYDFIATAIFTDPHLATVGETEQEAKARLGEEGVLVFKSSFRAMKHTLGGSQERSLMKLVVERESDRVVGAHMMGPDAGEIIQGLAIAMNAGATKAIFDQTIGIHPTAAEEFVTLRTPVAPMVKAAE